MCSNNKEKILTDTDIENRVTAFLSLQYRNTNTHHAYWHYTSLASLISMFHVNDNLCDKEMYRFCEMWASNIHYMNDISEYKEGVKYCKKIKLGISDKINAYIISFCGSGDILGQWKYYGKHCGVSIKFNFDNIGFDNIRMSYNNNKDTSNFGIYTKYGIQKKNDAYAHGDTALDLNTKPIYVSYTQKDRATLVELMQKNNLPQNLHAYILIPNCKNIHFKEENESRLIFLTYKGSGFDYDLMCNTNDPNNIKPAMKIRFFSTKEDSSLIEQIIVGPGENQNRVFNTLIHIFDSNNYKFYDDDEFQKIGKTIPSEKFLVNAECGKLVRVNWGAKNEEKIRWSYKCENGIIIMKSSIPFRG